MGDVASNIPDGAERIQNAGLESYGSFFRLPEVDGVNRFLLIADAPVSAGHTLLLCLCEGAMAAVASAVLSLSCDFVAEQQTSTRIEVHVRVVRRTRSLVFLTAELSADERVLLTANGLARPAV